MHAEDRIDAALKCAIDGAAGPACPPGLAEAMRYAVFPGGHRIRPQLCLAVATAQAGSDDAVVDAALSSIELLHCASLVHDDMPCFDDAPTRRGKPSVHLAFGESQALLCGDALIVLAFQTLAAAAQSAPRRAGLLLGIVSGGVGAPNGIVAGQAWECESAVALTDYQRAKTGVLFAAATMAGAAAAGADHEPWRELGERIGAAYQVADDLLDRFADPLAIGKPVGQDARYDRPNAVGEMGVDGASRRLKSLIEDTLDAVPDCPGRDDLRALIAREAGRFSGRALEGRAAA